MRAATSTASGSSCSRCSPALSLFAPRTRWRSSTSTARSRCRNCRRSSPPAAAAASGCSPRAPRTASRGAAARGRGAGRGLVGVAARAARSVTSAVPRSQRTRPQRSCSRRHRPQWVAAACARWRGLLVDHANCEKKAASTALALMFAYPEDCALSLALSRLAREELRHFETGGARHERSSACPSRAPAPGRYARGLRARCAPREPGAQARPAAGRRADRGALGGALRACWRRGSPRRSRGCTPISAPRRRVTSSCT